MVAHIEEITVNNNSWRRWLLVTETFGEMEIYG